MEIWFNHPLFSILQEPTDDKNILERERELKELKEIRFDIVLTIALIFHSKYYL